MDIDFSKLEGIAASQRPQEPQKATQEGPQTDTASLADIRLKRDQEDHQRVQEIWKEYQKNIRESELIQAEILKGVDTGEDPEALLLKACKVISQMTGNPPFYTHVERTLKKKTGEDLLSDPKQEGGVKSEESL